MSATSAFSGGDVVDIRDPSRSLQASTASPFPPRILHVCTRFARGGSEQRLRDIVLAAPECDHEVLVGGESDVELLQSQLPMVRVRHEPSLRRAVHPVRDVTALVRLRRIIDAGDYDVVVTHQSKSGVLGRVAARGPRRTPVVHSLSMADFGDGYGRVENRVFRMLERRLARWTEAYVVVGSDLADRFTRLGIPEHKVTVVRSGIRVPTPPRSRDDARRRVAHRFALPAERPWILYVGSLDERKNVLALPIVLQQAIQLSLADDPFLVVAGDGPHQQQLRSLLAQMGLEDDSRLLGYVDDPDDLFPAADAVVLLSRAEGLPQVLVQAAAVGTPYVATAIDGADEMLALGASGTVVDHDDIVGAARALLPYLRWPVQTCEPKIDLSSWRQENVHAEHRSVLRSVMTAPEPPTRLGGQAEEAGPPAPPEGAVIALIGSDGSGKSTISHALVESLAEQQPTVHLYMGSGDGPSSLLRWPMTRVRRAVFGAKGTSERKEAVHQRAPRAVRASRPLWALALAREKQVKLRRAQRAADRGTIVVCDRWPQAQVPGSTDGPLLDPWGSSSSRLRRLVAGWEAKPYQRAHRAQQPDLVLRLLVDQEVAEARRPTHDPEELEQRRGIVAGLRFDGARHAVIDIDANQPLDAVLAQATAAVRAHFGSPDEERSEP